MHESEDDKIERDSPLLAGDGLLSVVDDVQRVPQPLRSPSPTGGWLLRDVTPQPEDDGAAVFLRWQRRSRSPERRPMISKRGDPGTTGVLAPAVHMQLASRN